MKDPLVLARCNMFGVLKNFEYLAENDKECADLIKDKNIAVQFNIKNGFKANISFKNGKVEVKEGKHKSNMTLFFTSPAHFNKMVEGTGNPIPLKGITKIGFLTGPFTKMAAKLEYYLRADDKKLADKKFYKMNTEMTAYAAFFALAEIANYDDIGMASAHHIPNGVIQAKIGGSVGIWIDVQDGILRTFKGDNKDPRANMGFKDIEIAHGILNNKLDSFTAIALGDMTMNGYIPMVEHMNPILDLVSVYLA